MEISNRHILITGANRGIGRALAKMCSQEGAHLHLAVRQNDQELTAEMLAAGAKTVKLWISDLSTREGAESLLRDLGEQRIDILINNAGVLTGGLLEEQPLDEIYRMLQVNVSSLIHLTHGLLPKMLKNGTGKIINNSSVSAIMHFPCASTYAASKAAVLAFTDCLNVELKGTGVTTLCLVTPGVKTRMFDEIEVKYGKNVEVPKDSISAEEYAKLVRQSILNDDEYLEPTGSTGVGLLIARHLPRFFQKTVQRRFKR